MGKEPGALSTKQTIAWVFPWGLCLPLWSFQPAIGKAPFSVASDFFPQFNFIYLFLVVFVTLQYCGFLPAHCLNLECTYLNPLHLPPICPLGHQCHQPQSTLDYWFIYIWYMSFNAILPYHLPHPLYVASTMWCKFIPRFTVSFVYFETLSMCEKKQNLAKRAWIVFLFLWLRQQECVHCCC